MSSAAPLGDARRTFDLYDPATSGLAIVKSEAEKKALADIVSVFPPRVDGYLFVNQKEVQAVVALHAALKDLRDDCAWTSLDVQDTRVLLCFARARKLDVSKAEAMWRDAHAWRKAVDPEKTLQGYILPSVLDKHGTGGQFGLDKDGSPIMIDNLGSLDPSSVLKHVSDSELLESEQMKLEMLQALVDRRVLETGRPHWGCTIIIDLHGLGRQHFNTHGLHALRLILEQVSC